MDPFHAHLHSVINQLVRLLSLLSFLCCASVTIAFAPCTAMAESQPAGTLGKYYGPVPSVELGKYEASAKCSSCHENIYKQFSQSMHAKSFMNPVFQAEFFGELLPRHKEDKSLGSEVASCVACHSPITFTRIGGGIYSGIDVNPSISGVECDFCHTITGYEGKKPENGNYVAEPSSLKLGPFKEKSDWHHAYSELQTKSEICAICHNRVNRYGLEIISTFTEWQESRYSKKGIQCQDCHMNVQGFLTGGKAVYDSGQASQNSLTISPNRSVLYTHRFPGAHSESQVKGAIQLDIKVDKASLVPGEEAELYVIVDNSKSGHKLPTGSAELRLLYLDLTAVIGDAKVSIPADSLHDDQHDVSGMGKYDADVLRDDIPAGRRLYRAICVNPQGQQTQYSFDAEKIVFDNRLLADEIRKEIYRFKVPEGAGEELSFIATLYYLRYPDTFAEDIGVVKVKPVELASVRIQVPLGH